MGVEPTDGVRDRSGRINWRDLCGWTYRCLRRSSCTTVDYRSEGQGRIQIIRVSLERVDSVSQLFCGSFVFIFRILFFTGWFFNVVVYQIRGGSLLFPRDTPKRIHWSFLIFVSILISILCLYSFFFPFRFYHCSGGSNSVFINYSYSGLIFNVGVMVVTPCEIKCILI